MDLLELQLISLIFSCFKHKSRHIGYHFCVKRSTSPPATPHWLSPRSALRTTMMMKKETWGGLFLAVKKRRKEVTCRNLPDKFISWGWLFGLQVRIGHDKLSSIWMFAQGSCYSNLILFCKGHVLDSRSSRWYFSDSTTNKTWFLVLVSRHHLSDWKLKFELQWLALSNQHMSYSRYFWLQ